MEKPEQKEEPPEPTVLCCFPGYNDVAGREDARFGKSSPDNDAAHRRHPRPCCDARLVSVVIDSHRAGRALGIGYQPNHPDSCRFRNTSLLRGDPRGTVMHFTANFAGSESSPM